jgi:hypothetical protein
MAFQPDRPLDDEEGDKPHLAIAIGVSPKKTRSAFKPDAPLDGEEDGGDETDAETRAKEGCEILAKMISAGRVDAKRLQECLHSVFQAFEDMPHSENEEGEEEDKGGEYDKEGN